jgi:hypothetical protein
VQAVLVAAFNYALRFVFGGATLKLVALFLFFGLSAGAATYAIGEYAAPAINATGLPKGLVYMMLLFKVPEGLAVVFAALAVRFMIRRVPFFG